MPPAADPAHDTVSVFIPAYNGEDFIGEAIESCLGHDYPPHEVIVVDDCSSDETAARASAYDGVRVLRHDHNQGQAAARNTAIAAASGEFVASLDQDDRNLPGRLRLQVQALLSQPDRAAVIGTARHFHESGARAPDAASGWVIEEGGAPAGLASDAAQRSPIASTLLFRRSAVEEQGAYDPSVSFGDDMDLALRFMERDQLLMLPDQLIERRIHADNQTSNHAETMRSFALTMKRRIDRRRAEG